MSESCPCGSVIETVGNQRGCYWKLKKGRHFGESSPGSGVSKTGERLAFSSTPADESLPCPMPKCGGRTYVLGSDPSNWREVRKCSSCETAIPGWDPTMRRALTSGLTTDEALKALRAGKREAQIEFAKSTTPPEKLRRNPIQG